LFLWQHNTQSVAGNRLSLYTFWLQIMNNTAATVTPYTRLGALLARGPATASSAFDIAQMREDWGAYIWCGTPLNGCSLQLSARVASEVVCLHVCVHVLVCVCVCVCVTTNLMPGKGADSRWLVLLLIEGESLTQLVDCCDLAKGREREREREREDVLSGTFVVTRPLCFYAIKPCVHYIFKATAHAWSRKYAQMLVNRTTQLPLPSCKYKKRHYWHWHHRKVHMCALHPATD